ncbi:signal-regulatory protein beta-2-like [Cololabis saira]|uniref:signal-regulatory protein beta-2-like n=1 Tax=Cololabis saira TaxID=129043 RepID=UPI002AD4B75D|nr:signal-regulatory protein beta-2-like [Cololabis saira]
MLIIFLVLGFRMGGCTDNLMFETKTVAIGDDVTLKCPRLAFEYGATFYWIRLLPGNRPEFLGGTYSFDYNSSRGTSRITVKQAPQTFILHINGAKMSDTGLYYCMKVQILDMTFLKGEFLSVKGAEPKIIAKIQSKLVHPGEQITLNCSVFSDSQKKTCPSNVYWFRAGSDESHPSLIYAHKNSSGDCNSSPETHSAQKCDYSFSKTVSSTDAGTYYCAVASCGQILFGNGAKLEINASKLWDLQTANTVLCLLCAALTTSLVVIAFLIYAIRKKPSDAFRDAVRTGVEMKSQQKDEVTLIYSAPTFTRRNAGKEDNMNAPTSEVVYASVDTLETD